MTGVGTLASKLVFSEGQEGDSSFLSPNRQLSVRSTDHSPFSFLPSSLSFVSLFLLSFLPSFLHFVLLSFLFVMEGKEGRKGEEKGRILPRKGRKENTEGEGGKERGRKDPVTKEKE